MRVAAWSVLIYALIVAAGGVFAYIHASSAMSLLMSLPFAIALGVSVPGIFKAKRVSLIVSLLLILVLDAFFTYRYSQSLAWMPAGMMVVVSLITLSAIIYGVRKTAQTVS